jgi:hypothetical protein
VTWALLGAAAAVDRRDAPVLLSAAVLAGIPGGNRSRAGSLDGRVLLGPLLTGRGRSSAGRCGGSGQLEGPAGGIVAVRYRFSSGSGVERHCGSVPVTSLEGTFGDRGDRRHGVCLACPVRRACSRPLP